MAIFEYTAIDANNAIFRGELSSWTKRHAVRQLSDQRMTVITVKKIRRWGMQLTWLRRGVSSMDRIVFTRSLTTMINAGMNISEALTSTREQSANPVLKKAIAEIEQRIQSGQSLAACFASYPAIFPTELVAMIKVGERSGKLTEVLQYLTEKLERDYQLRRKIRNAMVYPVLILCFMIIMVAVMMLFVIPRVASVYAESNVVLPLYTRMLVATSTFVTKYIWAIAAGLIILVVAYNAIMKRSYRARRFMHRVFLRMPMVGVIVKKSNLVVISRTLSMVLKSGMTIDEALILTSQTTRNTIYQEKIQAAEPFVARGVRLSDIFIGSPEMFPPVFQRMVATGEQTGNLDAMFSNVAQYYHEDIEHWSTNFSAVIEPFLISFVGVVVGAIAVAILFPLWNFVNVIS